MRRFALLVVLGVVLASGCGAISATPTASPVPSAAAATLAPSPTPAEQAPVRLGHVFLIVLENKDYAQVIGSPDAPYLNSLVKQGVLAVDYYAVAHPSLPNYLALLGGDTFGIADDCTTCFLSAPSLPDLLEAHGMTWKSYQEDLPQPCFLGAEADGSYALRHDPFLYFHAIRDNPTRCANVVPFTQFVPDLQGGKAPDFSWITPNLNHDMHNGTIADGDRWLASQVPEILASDAWRRNGALILVWDEGNATSLEGCCGQKQGGGRVPLLILAPFVQAGSQWTQPANHYSLLHTLEEAWNLGYLGRTADAAIQSISALLPGWHAARSPAPS